MKVSFVAVVMEENMETVRGHGVGGGSNEFW